MNEQVSALGNSLSHIPLQVLLFHIRFNKFKYLDNICIDVCKHYKPCTCLWHLDICVCMFTYDMYTLCVLETGKKFVDGGYLLLT